MQLSDHLAKSTWAFLDKVLPLVYGVGMVLIGIRILPKEEYGVFVIIQSLFYLLLNLAQHSLTRPMIKLVSADEKNMQWALPITTYAIYLWFIAGMLVFTLLAEPIGQLLNVENFNRYIGILWLLSFTFLPKTIILPFLGSQLRTFQIFLLNAIYFLGSLLGLLLYWHLQILDTAKDIFVINIIAASLSSLLGVALIARIIIRIRWRIQWDRIHEMTSFGKYTFGYGLSRIAYQQADTYIIAALMGPVEVALYNAAKTFLRLYNVIAQAISTLIFPVMSKLQARNRKAELQQVFEKGVCFYSLILFPVNILLIFLAKYIFIFAYGDKYPGAVPIFQILILGTFFHPLASIGNSAVLGLNKPNYQFWLTLVTSGINIGMNFLLIPIYKSLGAAIGASAALVLDGFLLYFLIKREIPVTVGGIAKRTGDAWRFARQYLSKKPKTPLNQRGTRDC
jgi:O-antigen/teichoic acid export membrane protein